MSPTQRTTIMADALYLPYLLVLLLLPLLARWRWGLPASLVVTAVELPLVVLVFYLMDVYRLFPDVFIGEPPPQHPLEKIRRSQAGGYVLLVLWGAGPAVAALIGGGAAVAWSIILAVRRAIANRPAA
jgi:hypothetical protein